MQRQPTPVDRTLRAPSDARELLLAFDPSQLDVPIETCRAAGLWASHWIESEPDALIVMACNERARNKDEVNRLQRLRQLAEELVRHDVPRGRIRFTTTGTTTPVCSQAGERGLAWFKVLRPEQLEVGVRSIDTLFEEPTTRPVP